MKSRIYVPETYADELRRKVRELQEDHVALADQLAAERLRAESFKATAIAMRPYTSVVGCRILRKALEGDLCRVVPKKPTEKQETGGDAYDGRFALRQ